MAATIRASYFNSTGPTAASAETGIKFNREDTQIGTTPIPIPTTAGTNYSWYKVLGLEVTGTDTTNVTNRRIRMASSPAGGLNLVFYVVGTYTQATSGNKPADNGSSQENFPTSPVTYVQMTTSDQQYDNTSVATSSTGINGDYVQVALGVYDSYGGGGGTSQPVPSIILTYDEA